MTRLSSSTVQQVSGASLPTYDRDQACGVIHLGVGAFHRAHQARYFDQLLEQGEAGWMIRGASLRSARVSEQLNPQDGLFTVLVRDRDVMIPIVCGSVKDVLVAPQNPGALVAAMADPEIQLVTLTITEKGYGIDPASGELRKGDADIDSDLKSLDHPKTAPGFLVAALKQRRDAGLAPFTVLSCDNLPDNGERTRDAVVAMAQAHDPDLANWIAAHGAFPSSMVDRIVPKTEPSDLDAFEAEYGVRDEALVKTEPFTQWVVEDKFCGTRPPLEAAGVQMTNDVAGWENAKLRLLNGSHSALAYLGNLGGFDFVHQAFAALGYERFINRLWDEAEATLSPVNGFDPAHYRDQLKARFLNSALEHQTFQIAMDGSQKLPQRFLNTIRDRNAKGLESPAFILAVAAWMRWQSGVDESGQPYTVDDPMASRTRAVWDEHGHDPASVVAGLTSIAEIFGDELSQDEVFKSKVASALNKLLEKGAAQSVADFA